MSIFDHWQAQRDTLRLQLDTEASSGQVVSMVRHAILQTEQNALAEISDDVLRQQTGLLLDTIRSNVGLLEVPMASQVWVPQQIKKKKGWKQLGPTAVSLLAVAALMLFLYTKSLWNGLVLGALSLICQLAGLWKRPLPALPRDEARVTLRPDVERLFALLDEQMRAADRQLNDFSYLNDQLRNSPESADEATLSHAADLLEALYECAPDERDAAEAAARRMLSCMGLCALDYSNENSGLFNTLPSKTETRTLSPAIVSAQDRKLLRRGTAAVRVGAA